MPEVRSMMITSSASSRKGAWSSCSAVLRITGLPEEEGREGGGEVAREGRGGEGKVNEDEDEEGGGEEGVGDGEDGEGKECEDCGIGLQADPPGPPWRAMNSVREEWRETRASCCLLTVPPSPTTTSSPEWGLLTTPRTSPGPARCPWAGALTEALTGGNPSGLCFGLCCLGGCGLAFSC